ncbi:MAG: sigma-70 family RNA polymerase sigma factor [Acidimicrobiales bacterium]
MTPATAPPESPADAEWSQRLAHGDGAVLAEVYARHCSSVFNVALRVTGELPAAEEVTQDVFLDLWRRPERFDPARGALGPWLATVAHHRSVDHVRGASARRRREQRDVDAGSGHVHSVDEIVAAALGAERVRAALAELDEKERSAIVLAYFGGRTYREVAADLGVAEGTIKSRIRTGLRHLADNLRVEPVGAAF